MADNIQSAFDKTIIGNQLPESVIDIAETSIDNLLNNDVIKTIPVVKVIAGFLQTGANIQDKLFLKKILVFLQRIESVTEEERKIMIKEIDGSGKHKVKVGEKLLYILDSCDDYTNAENVANLFSAMLKKKITYRQYVQAAQVIARISKDDLDWFISSFIHPHYLDDSASSLAHTGLVYSETSDVEVEIEKVEKANWKDPEEYYKANTSGGHMMLYPTSAGEAIFEVFGIGKEKLEQQIRERSEKEKAKLHKSITGLAGVKI